MRTIGIALLTTTFALALATASHGAATPAQKCLASKLKAAGKKAACRMMEAAKEATGGVPNLAKCSDKFSNAFSKAETKATPGVCPTEGDTAAIESRIDTATTDIAGALRCSNYVGGACWYFGAPGASCDATCAALGKTCDPATMAYAGSDATGGTLAHCAEVLYNLEAIGPYPTNVACDSGEGCIFNTFNYSLQRCNNPATTCAAADVTLGALARVCACQ